MWLMLRLYSLVNSIHISNKIIDLSREKAFSPGAQSRSMNCFHFLARARNFFFDCGEFLLKRMFCAIKTHKAFICVIIFYCSLMDSGNFLAVMSLHDAVRFLLTAMNITVEYFGSPRWKECQKVECIWRRNRLGFCDCLVLMVLRLTKEFCG